MLLSSRCISIFDRSGNAVNRISLSGHGNLSVWLNCGTLACTVDGDIYNWKDPTSTDLKHSVNVLKQSVLHGKSGTHVTATAGSNANDLALGFDDGTIIVYAEAEADGKHGLQDVYNLSSPSGKVRDLAKSRYILLVIIAVVATHDRHRQPLNDLLLILLDSSSSSSSSSSPSSSSTWE